MAQVKKAEIRDLILEAALAQFSDRGYSDTTMRDIARGAGVSASNIYNYFGSKLAILFAIYDPWLRERLRRLERDLAHEHDPRDKLRLIFRTLWQTIPAENNAFANNLMQALSTAMRDDGYTQDLLQWCETAVRNMIADAVGRDGRDGVDLSALAHISFMAFDGFALGQRLARGPVTIDRYVETMVALLVGTDGRRSRPRSLRRRSSG